MFVNNCEFEDKEVNFIEHLWSPRKTDVGLEDTIMDSLEGSIGDEDIVNLGMFLLMGL